MARFLPWRSRASATFARTSNFRMSLCSSCSRPLPANRSSSRGTSDSSFSTAMTYAPVARMAFVSAPVPGPISSTTSSAVHLATRTMP
eukprot:scaffold176_cov356-Prasinococcus_capsulatus_cf.AAC.6